MQVYTNPSEYLYANSLLLEPDRGDAMEYLKYLNPSQARIKVIKI
jgi:hypothetical protein